MKDLEKRMESFTIHRQLDEQRAEEITARLVAYNQAHAIAMPSAPHQQQPLHVFALDEAGTLRGGLVGRTHATPQWLEISIVYVDEKLRHQGMGSRLMHEGESEALRRGCRFARLSTGNFQAPGFYERLGYQRYGLLANYPPGVTAYYYWKALTMPEDGPGTDAPFHTGA